MYIYFWQLTDHTPRLKRRRLMLKIRAYSLLSQREIPGFISRSSAVPRFVSILIIYYRNTYLYGAHADKAHSHLKIYWGLHLGLFHLIPCLLIRSNLNIFFKNVKIKAPDTN